MGRSVENIYLCRLKIAGCEDLIDINEAIWEGAEVGVTLQGVGIGVVKVIYLNKIHANRRSCKGY